MGFGVLFARGKHDGDRRSNVLAGAAGCASAAVPAPAASASQAAGIDVLADGRVLLAASFASRLRGLIRRPKFDGVCLLAHCGSIHTFGMRGKIDVAFVDCRGKVLSSCRGLPPGKVRKARGAVCALERLSSADPWLEEGDYVTVGAVRADGRGAKEGVRP